MYLFEKSDLLIRDIVSTKPYTECPIFYKDQVSLTNYLQQFYSFLHKTAAIFYYGRIRNSVGLDSQGRI